MKNLLKVFLLCFIALFAFAAQSMGQGKTITGQVVDALNESMPGVNVQVKGTTNGTITNIDGKFSISVPNSKSVLIFTFIGYSKQEIVVGNQAKINVQLKSLLSHSSYIPPGKPALPPGLPYGQQTAQHIDSNVSLHSVPDHSTDRHKRLQEWNTPA